jgi:hypothetical protein
LAFCTSCSNRKTSILVNPVSRSIFFGINTPHGTQPHASLGKQNGHAVYDGNGIEHRSECGGN